uniref:Uncharacterized protein n=1 Tax=Rhizophora mucronata TaxID=61149 RepID=A0A2P2KHZ8_RHIMU
MCLCLAIGETDHQTDTLYSFQRRLYIIITVVMI